MRPKVRSRRGLSILGVVLAAGCASSSPSPVTPTPSAGDTDVVGELGEIPWYSAARAWDAQEVQQPAFTLNAGRVGDPDPTVTASVPMAFGIELLDTVRTPAAAANLDGLLVYVADDGSSSALHRTSVDGGPDQVVAELPGLVWSLALAPDGGSAYLIVLDRETGGDLGVWQTSLDGAQAIRRVIDPAAEPLGRGEPMPVARISYSAGLLTSLDGSLLARRSCGGLGRPFECAVDVLHVATGVVQRLDADFSGRLVGVAAHWAVGVTDCAEVGCPTVLVDLLTGRRTELPGAPDGLALTEVDGEPVLASTAGIREIHSFAIEARWLTDGRTETILRTPADRPVYLDGGAWWRAVLPAGWVEVGFDHPNWRGTFALRVTDGVIVPLLAPDVDPMPPPQAVPAGPATSG